VAHIYPGRGLHGDVVETVATRITSGRYQPGDLIFAETLERDLGVSKTVVREALKVLAAKGLVESRPKRGTTVRPRASWNLLDPDLLRWRGGQPDPDFLRDLSEVRSIVEPEGARLAAGRHEPADLDDLDAALDAMAAPDASPSQLVEADLAFHRALLRAAHNELLSRMEVVIEAALRVRDQLVHGTGRGADALAEHQAIANAVHAGDAAAAAAATRSLLIRAMADEQASLRNVAHTPKEGPAR
jgi:GntR family transcriptional regulator, galactonate operon transcriptional repressor